MEQSKATDADVFFGKAMVVADILKKRFPNLTVMETMELAKRIVRSITIEPASGLGSMPSKESLG